MFPVDAVRWRSDTEPMSRRGVRRILGLLIMAFSATLLPPAAVATVAGDGQFHAFLLSFLLIFGMGAFCWYPVRHESSDLQNQSAFLVVAFYWCGLGAIGALPFVCSNFLGPVDALFETVSGFTTTGATVIEGLDGWPASLLYYRAQLQWLGGMGVVVLALAVLPALKVGGMQLLRAETPGPMKDEKLTPRIRETARALWLLYLGITVACALAYFTAGMSLLDAVAHSMATVSTGGFSTHDASFSSFHSPGIEVIAEVFMLIGGINFGLHFIAWRGKSLHRYLIDAETRVFILTILFATGLVSATLYLSGKYTSTLDSLRVGLFEVISVITTTGFGIENFSTWPTALPVFLIFLGFVGGCAGSTAGGIKVVRVMMLVKQGMHEFFVLSHPRGVSPVKLNGKPISERTMATIWSFFAVYVVTFAVLMMIVMFAGADQVTAFSAIATSMNNLGPGLGRVAVDFANVNDAIKLSCVTAMLLGRLEIMTLLILLSPDFWRG